MSVVSDYRAILAYLDSGNYRWNAFTALGTPVFVSYNFVETEDLPDPASLDYSPSETLSYSPAQREAFRRALDEIEDNSGIRFVEVDGEAMIHAMAVTGSEWGGGWAFYPSVGSWGTSSSSLFLDITDGEKLSGFDFDIVLHELGHALGLSHPHRGNIQLEPHLDSTSTTLMSYNWASVPQLSLPYMDVDALQHIYGTSADVNGWNYGFQNGVFRATGSVVGERIVGIMGDNNLHGRGGADVLIGREENDTLKGGAGADILIGFSGADHLYGGKGNDVLWASQRDLWSFERDLLIGGNGADKLHGDAGFDTLKGQNGNDTLKGGEGNDELNGGRHADRLFGGDGYDVLEGGHGKDVLTGGDQPDIFRFRASAAGARDRITDFEPGVDEIDLQGTGFSGAEARLVRGNGGQDTIMLFDGDGGFSIRFQNVEKSELVAVFDYDLFV